MTCQGISLGLVSIGCCCFLFVTRRGVFYFVFTRSVSEVTGFLCPEFANFRIVSFTRKVAEITDFFVPIFSLSRIIELSNIFHTECRGGHGFFLITRLVLGPTDRREVIREFFLHTDCRGIIFFITNYRIIEYLSHGVSRRSRGFSLSRIFEFSNCFFTRKVAEITDFFVPRLVLGPTDQRGVIAEFLSITRSVADGCGACSTCEWGLFVVVYRPIRGVCV